MTILKAAQFAYLKHKTQFRKWTNKPYFEHLSRVASRVASLDGMDEYDVSAGYLHDVIEDCYLYNDWKVGFTELEDRFGFIVSNMVRQLTSTPKESGLNRTNRKALEREKLSKASSTIKIIKLVDVIDNLNDMPYGIDGCPDSFRRTYVYEAKLLFDILKNNHSELDLEFLDAINKQESYIDTY